MPSIWWCRRDLRLADNPALLAAVDAARDAGTRGDDVVALYVLDPRLSDRTGAPRRAYLARSLAALDGSTGGRLVVRHGDPRAVVPALAREVGAEEVHVAESFEPYGRSRDDTVEQSLPDVGARLVRTGSPYAVSPGRLATQGGTPFQVFTPFRDAWVAHGWRDPVPRPREIPFASVRSDGVPADPGTDAALPAAGEAAVRRRWHAFLADHLAGYATGRDRPDLPATSGMSIPLKWGEVHPRTLLADLRAALQ